MNKKHKKTYHKGQTVSFRDAPKEVQDLMKELVMMCPFRKEAITDLENIAVKFTRQIDGWQFVCNVCPHTRCTGFILDTPQSSGKKGTRFYMRK